VPRFELAVVHVVSFQGDLLDIRDKKRSHRRQPVIVATLIYFAASPQNAHDIGAHFAGAWN
jgi:hypothetical protein